MQIERHAHRDALLALLNAVQLASALLQCPAVKNELASRLLTTVQQMLTESDPDSEASQAPSKLLQAAVAIAPTALLHVAHHLSAWLAEQDGDAALALQAIDKALDAQQDMHTELAQQAQADEHAGKQSSLLASQEVSCMMMRLVLLAQVCAHLQSHTLCVYGYCWNNSTGSKLCGSRCNHGCTHAEASTQGWPDMSRPNLLPVQKLCTCKGYTVMRHSSCIAVSSYRSDPPIAATSTQMGRADDAAAQLAELVKHANFEQKLLDVLLKDAMQRGTLPTLRSIVRRLFDLCHCRKGETPPVDIAQLQMTSGDMLRQLLQMHAVQADAELSAKEQIERSIGQPCTWSHLDVDAPDLQLAGAVPILVLTGCPS